MNEPAPTPATGSAEDSTPVIRMPAAGACPANRHETPDSNGPACALGPPAPVPTVPVAGPVESARDCTASGGYWLAVDGTCRRSDTSPSAPVGTSTAPAVVAPQEGVGGPGGGGVGPLSGMVAVVLLGAVLAGLVHLLARQPGPVGRHAGAVRTGGLLLGRRVRGWAGGHCAKVVGRRKRPPLRLRVRVVRWAVLLAGPALLLAVSRVLFVVALLGLAAYCWHKGRKVQPEAAAADWWGIALDKAMVRAGIVTLPKLAEGEKRTAYLGRLGPPVRNPQDEQATSVKVRLPAGVTVSVVLSKREALASHLGLALDRLEVRPHPDESPAVVTIAYRSVRQAVVPTAEVATLDRTTWGEPRRIGLDPVQGGPVLFQTEATHTAVAGLTRRGKTVCCQQIVAGALLDPDVTLHLINGKGAASDWDDLGRFAQDYVARMGPDAADRVRALLATVLALVAQRNGSGSGPWGGVLVVVEEWGAVRAAVEATGGANALKAVDDGMKLLLATSASAGVHTLLIQQRITKDSFPTSQSANVGQRLVFGCANRLDVAMALGEEPTADLPSTVGHALLTNDLGRQQRVVVANLTAADRRAVLARLEAVRPSTPVPVRQAGTQVPGPVPVAVPSVAMVKVEPEAVEPFDPLLAAVVEVLADRDPAGLQPSALWKELPEWIRPDSAQRLGSDLAEPLADRMVIRVAHVGKTRVIRLAAPGAPGMAVPSPRTAPGKAPASPRKGPGPGATGGSSTPGHAQTGHSGEVPGA